MRTDKCLFIAALMVCSLASRAEADAVTPESTATTPAPATTPERPNPLGATALDNNKLAQKRGGTQVLNDMKLNGTVANNQAVNVATGSNNISDGAFSGAAGLPMVIQNSGNNVLIQNATIVNVQVK